jgi:Uma2 family endonuclease
MIITSKATMTENEYLSFEETAMVRHELYHGNLKEMPGGTKFHERLIKNLFLLLSAQNQMEHVELFFSGMRLNIPGFTSYYYPDLMLVREGSRDETYFQDAIFIAEVLSPATRTFDMVDKFLDYRSLPSLQYYLLAEPEYYHVTLHTKGADGTWQSDTYRKLTDLIDLTLIGAQLPMAEIYQGLVWE